MCVSEFYTIFVIKTQLLSQTEQIMLEMDEVNDRLSSMLEEVTNLTAGVREDVKELYIEKQDQCSQEGIRS